MGYPSKESSYLDLKNQSSLKVTKSSKFQYFFLISFVFTMNGSTILFGKHRKIKCLRLKGGNFEMNTSVNIYMLKNDVYC